MKWEPIKGYGPAYRAGVRYASLHPNAGPEEYEPHLAAYAKRKGEVLAGAFREGMMTTYWNGGQGTAEGWSKSGA